LEFIVSGLLSDVTKISNQIFVFFFIFTLDLIGLSMIAYSALQSVKDKPSNIRQLYLFAIPLLIWVALRTIFQVLLYMLIILEPGGFDTFPDGIFDTLMALLLVNAILFLISSLSGITPSYMVFCWINALSSIILFFSQLNASIDLEIYGVVYKFLITPIIAIYTFVILNRFEFGKSDNQKERLSIHSVKHTAQY
ncbi:MAG: hypothetical protein ACC656_10310, partial [Candidatus Heimdallarchaeota archaeon]